MIALRDCLVFLVVCAAVLDFFMSIDRYVMGTSRSVYRLEDKSHGQNSRWGS